MKITVHHACGHEAEQQFFGRDSERKAKRAWMESRPCAKCWREQQSVVRDAENDLRAAVARAIIARYPDRDPIEITAQVQDADSEKLQALRKALGL